MQPSPFQAPRAKPEGISRVELHASDSNPGAVSFSDLANVKDEPRGYLAQSMR
jgi:hypothetical protein